MCQYLSLIVTKDFKVLWLPENPIDHEAIINKYNLERETSETMRGFVRVEISPLDWTKVSPNQKDWKYHVDINDPDCLPAWFKANRKKIEGACWKAWKESLAVNVLFEGERRVKDGYLICLGSSRGVLNGSSQGVFYDSSRGVLRSIFATAIAQGKLWVLNKKSVGESSAIEA